MLLRHCLPAVLCVKWPAKDHAHLTDGGAFLFRKRYIAAALLAAALLVIAGILLWHRAGTEGKSRQEKEDDPVTFDWYINYSWFRDGWGENAVSKQITKDTGVSVNFKTPVGDGSNSLDTMISSGTLPDLVTLGYWEPEVNRMIAQKQVYALNALADEFDPAFYDVSDPESVEWYTMSDGNIYAYPNSSYTLQDFETHDNIPSNQVFIVRKDIYEAIGSPDMTTPEGFMNAVRLAAAMFPEVDGEPLIPVGGNFFDQNGCTSFDQYLQNSLAVPYEKDGSFYDRNTDPEYLSWLRVFRQLNADGLISPDIFVDGRTQISEKIAAGRYFCMFYQWIDMKDQEMLICNTDPSRAYIAVDGPRNAAGDPPVLPVASVQGWTVTLISRNCSDPEKAIKFIDYLLSEKGQKTVYLGVEGVTYENDAEGRPKYLPEVQRLLESDRTTFNEKYGADDTYWMLQDNVMQLEWAQDCPAPLLEMQRYTYPYASYTGQYTISIPENTSVGRKYVNCARLWSQTLKQLILAPSDEEFDAVLASYRTEREAAGFSDVLSEETRQMNENKARLGITGTGVIRR